MRYVLPALFLLFIFTGCNSGNNHVEKNTSGEKSSLVEVRFATGFTMRDFGTYTMVTVHNPWQNAEDVSYRYVLTKNDSIPSGINAKNRIKIPVKKIICLSTTHLGFLQFIGEIDAVVGVSGIRYVTNATIRKKFEKGEISDIGYNENINYEQIIRLQPDLVLAYGVSGTESGYLGKLEELGIRVMYIAEYLEENPLAKMEWVKVFAALFGKEETIAQKFDSVALYYQTLTAKAAQQKAKPKVLLGLPWRGTWYVSGGNSYVAQLISDAGGDYLWKDMDFSDSRPMGLETIYARALEADFWLNTSTVNSIKEILEVDERFKNLKAVKDKNVYNYNKLAEKSGGNAYFETGVVEPDIILEDLITILHQDVLPSHQLKYYQKLQ